MSLNIKDQRKISINELPAEIPDFSSTFEPKDSIIKRHASFGIILNILYALKVKTWKILKRYQSNF